MSKVHSQEITRGALWPIPTPARRLLLIAPPLALAGLTVLHPQPDPNTQALVDASTWFMGYHMIQLPLIGLVVVSVFLLADGLGRASAWPTCIGMGAFLLFFGAYDSVAGIGTGLTMRSASGLPASQQDAVFDIVKGWPALEPWVFWLAMAGTFGWVLALGYLAVAARASGRPRSQWVFLALTAFFLLGGHPAPSGTIAFGALATAALLHEWQATNRQPESSGHRSTSPDAATRGPSRPGGSGGAGAGQEWAES